MTNEESIAEAERLLREAGWAPHNTWNAYTRGPLVMGFDPAGRFHVKNVMQIPPGHPQYGPDTPDTHHEAAAVLIATWGLAPAPEEAESAAHADVRSDNRESDPSPAVWDSDFSSQDHEGAAAVLGTTDDAATGANGALSTVGPDSGATASVQQPIDADFQELAALSYEEAPAEETPPEQSGGVAIFGDNFATMRLAKMGRLAQIAAEKSAAAFAAVGWTDDEYNAVQAHVVSNLAQSTGAYTGGQQAIYDRFMAMEAAKQRVNGFRVHRDQCTDYLNAADTPRVMVEQFDPDAGWPG